MRDLLDSQSVEANEMIRAESAAFTDYLNFFEFLGFLYDSGQIRKADIGDLFQYYIDQLAKYPQALDYINDPSKGYEKVRKLVNSFQE